MTARKTPPALDEVYGSTIDWNRVVERIRQAKTPETGVALLKRHVRSAFEFQEMLAGTQKVADARAKEQAQQTKARVEAMARAMAMAEPYLGKDHDYIADATRLDNALQMRKQYEI